MTISQRSTDRKLAVFVRMLANRPLTETIQMGIRFARGVWLARKFDTKGLVDTGRRVKIVKQNGEIHVDRYCRFRDDVEMAVVGENAGRKSILRIGYNSGLGARTKINVTDLVDIGDNCLIGWDCDIWDTSWHRVRFLDRESGPISSPVVIEDNVWVGAHTIIQRGVTIGANSVIAAGSVVIKDIPPNSFAAGNPSKVLKEIEGWEW